MEWLLVKTVLSLVGVLGLMIALMVLLKKYVYTAKAGSSAVVDVEVLGQRALQPKRSVVVLKVLNKVVIVGMTEHGMQVLTEIADDKTLAEIEALRASSRGANGNVQTFADHMRKYAGEFMKVRTWKGRREPVA
jgi:flagellar protein FliO/FliZ